MVRRTAVVALVTLVTAPLLGACSSDPEATTTDAPAPVTVEELMTNAFTWDRTNPVVRDPQADPDPALAYLATRALDPGAPSASAAALKLPLPADDTASASAELAWSVRRAGGDGSAAAAAQVLGTTAPTGLAPAAAAAGALALAGSDAARPWCERLAATATDPATTADAPSRVELARSRCGQPSTWAQTPLPQLPAELEDATAETVYDLAFDGADDVRDRAVEAARTYLTTVDSGQAQPSDRSLAMLALAAHAPPTGGTQVRLRQMELFAGTLPTQAVPDAFGQVMGLRAWQAVGGPPAGVTESFTALVTPVTGPLSVDAAIRHLGLGAGLPSGTKIVAGADEDPITAYGLTAVVDGAADCASTEALRPPLADLRTAAAQPMAIAPNRTVMLALAAQVEKACGAPQVTEVVTSLVTRQLADTTTASDQPYRLWGELEAACVLRGSLSAAEKTRATTTADRYLAGVVVQPSTRFGVGDVFGATRLKELATGCQGAWWAER